MIHSLSLRSFAIRFKKSYTLYYLSHFFFLWSFSTLSSCDDIIDCIINVRPELIDKDLKVGTVNEFYSDRVTAGIKNEPHDDDYDYYFGISGNLPEGLEWIVDHKDIYFEGVSMEAGTFNFTIHLRVEGPKTYDWDTDTYDDNLCYDETSQKFTIIIN